MYRQFDLKPNHLPVSDQPGHRRRHRRRTRWRRTPRPRPRSLKCWRAAAAGAAEMDAYERVLGDAMAGDATLFAREDYVEEAWRIVDPVLKAETPVFQYEPQTWGPQRGRAGHAARRLAQPGDERVAEGSRR